jgi:RNase H-fold protein (predicted Holliday junction resolvase)
VLSDERLSTAEAERLRREGGAQADLDSVAACVILESWLRAQEAAA